MLLFAITMIGCGGKIYTMTFRVGDTLYSSVGKYQEGDLILLPNNPTKEGYTFSGWSEAPATMPAVDVDVYGWYDVLTDIVEVQTEMLDNTIYNLKGQRLVNLRNQPPGIYIVGGKKVWLNNVEP